MSHRPTTRTLPLMAVLLLLSSTPALPSASSAPSGGFPIKHVIVIMEENHTFDNYFGTYPGANGISGAMAQPLSKNSTNYLKPFMLNTTTVWANPCETAACAHQAYDNGKMDGFVAANAGSNLTMGYFNPALIPYYWDYASQFVLLDNFYTSVMSNSLANHLYLVAGQSGGLVNDSRYSAFNFTSSTAHNNTFYFKPIMDELDASNVTWRYYAGGDTFLNNWNPMPAFESFKNDTARLSDVVDSSQFVTDVKGGNLPSVSWVMPETDQVSEHAPYDIDSGQSAVVSEINAVMSSGYWNSTAIFLTWDDWGGWYDHVPPPQVDGLGYGFRVPCLIISPYTETGVVDHTQGDFTSILKFIETVYSLPPLATRDALANNMMGAFNFLQAPSPPLALPGQFMPNHYPLTYPNGTLYSGPNPSIRVVGVTSTVTASKTATQTTTITSTLPPSTVVSTVTSTTTATMTSTSSTQTSAVTSDVLVGWLVTAAVLVGLAAFIASRRGTKAF